MSGASTLNLTPGITETHLPVLTPEDNEVSIEDEISITMKITTKTTAWVHKTSVTIIADLWVGLTNTRVNQRTNIALVPVQIVVKLITLFLNADTITELSVISVMSMVIRPDCVLIMHSNQRVTC